MTNNVNDFFLEIRLLDYRHPLLKYHATVLMRLCIMMVEGGAAMLRPSLRRKMLFMFELDLVQSVLEKL